MVYFVLASLRVPRLYRRVKAVYSNADRFAAAAVPDKVRFHIRDADAGEVAHGYYMTVMEQVQAATGWSEEYAKRHVKYMVAERKGQRSGIIIQLTWKACSACYGLSPAWLPRVVEVEMKAYLNERHDGAFDDFLDRLQNSDGKLNTYFYHHGVKASKRKSGASRSATVGSKKADKNVKAYKRQGERPGLEVGVRGKTVKRAAANVVSVVQHFIDPSNVRQAWEAFFTTCARIGYLAAARELTERGIDVADFFTHFTLSKDPADPMQDGVDDRILGGGGHGFTAV